MDGVEYTAEPEHMDDDDEDPERRGMSDSSRGRRDTGSYRGQGPSTYPPIGGRPAGANNVAQMYPPSSREQASPGLSSIQQFNGPGQGLGQNSVMESPKPPSPGQPDSQRGSASGPSSGRFQHYPGGRGSGPQLPPLPYTMAHGGMPPPGAGSLPGSMSSHGGSGAGARELFPQQSSEWVSYVRDLENRMAKMAEDHQVAVARLQSENSRRENEWQARLAQLEADKESLRDSHQAEISRLAEEVRSLRSVADEAVKA